MAQHIANTFLHTLGDTQPSLISNTARICRVTLLSPVTLAVADVNRSDRGAYQCLVTNRRSSAQAMAELRLGGEYAIYTSSLYKHGKMRRWMKPLIFEHL